MKKALKIAFTAGYKIKGLETYGVDWIMKYYSARSEILLDPKFWRVLGRAMGWKEHPEADSPTRPPFAISDEWYMVWHEFIDHLANGGDRDEFFKKLF